MKTSFFSSSQHKPNQDVDLTYGFALCTHVVWYSHTLFPLSLKWREGLVVYTCMYSCALTILVSDKKLACIELAMYTWGNGQAIVHVQ